MKHQIAFFFSLSCFLGLSSLLAQPVPTQESLAATIIPADMRAHLTILAGEAMEGRETGTEGQRKAADYIANHFKTLGFPPVKGTYFQPIGFRAQSWDNIRMAGPKDTLRHLWDYYAFPEACTNDAIDAKEIVFAGYGIQTSRYNDYADANVKGKVVLILDGEPFGQDSLSLAGGVRGRSEWSTDLNKKLLAAKENGVRLLLIVDPMFKENVGEARRTILGNKMEMVKPDALAASGNIQNHVFISSTSLEKILGSKYKKVVKARKTITRNLKPKTVTLSTPLQVSFQKAVRDLQGSNVMGYVEGSDPVLKNELLVLSAHYDHLGKRGSAIYHGADDNGSGSTTLLEVAQAYAIGLQQGIRPRRSVLFLLVSGEEKGLLGSEYYSEYPIFPLENTIADINVDMVGRVDPEYTKKDNPFYIYVIGSDRLSTDLHRINEEMNAKYTQLELNYTYNDDKDPNRFYYRSDHYNFAKKGIPSIFFFNGTHADYHMTSDTVEKINFDKMAVIGRLVFHLSWNLANRDERIKVDVTGRN